MNGRLNLHHKQLLSTIKLDYTIKKLIKETVNDTAEEDHRPPELRPSSMPFCSVILLRDLILQKEQKTSMKSDFYMSIGTVLHSVLQKWIPRQGRGLGDWVCVKETVRGKKKVKCGKRKKLTIDNICECGEIMTYEEIEVSYKGITGHIDYVISHPHGRKQIIDFKTSSLEKIRNKDIDGLVSYKYMIQILTYTYIVQELYGWKMMGSSLLFIARDSHDAYLEVFFPWNSKLSSMIEAFVESQIIAFNSAHKSLKEKNVHYAIRSRCCRNGDHYQKEVKDIFFGDCPMAGICVGMNELQTVKKYLEKELTFID